MYGYHRRPHEVTRWLQAHISHYNPKEEELERAIKRASDV